MLPGHNKPPAKHPWRQWDYSTKGNYQPSRPVLPGSNTNTPRSERGKK